MLHSMTKKKKQIVIHFQRMQNSSRPCAQHEGIWRIGGLGISPEIVAGDWSASRPRSFDPSPPCTAIELESGWAPEAVRTLLR
jgi:hypothetical protein